MPSLDRMKTGIWHQNTCDVQGSKWDLRGSKKLLGMYRGERNEEISQEQHDITQITDQDQSREYTMPLQNLAGSYF